MISIVVAVAENGVIGHENRLIWHISEDLKYFKQLTSGHTVVMGRKTYESIGRPLPNRTNIVISGQANFAPEGCTVVSSLDEALKLLDPNEENFIMGGGRVYSEALLVADKIYLTRVHFRYIGDTFFPDLNANEWEELSRKDFERGEKFEYPFSFIVYERKR